MKQLNQPSIKIRFLGTANPSNEFKENQILRKRILHCFHFYHKSLNIIQSNKLLLSLLFKL